MKNKYILTIVTETRKTTTKTISGSSMAEINNKASQIERRMAKSYANGDYVSARVKRWDKVEKNI